MALRWPDDAHAESGARDFYEGLTAAQQTSLLRKIYLSKRPETRVKWVAISVERLAAGDKPPY